MHSVQHIKSGAQHFSLCPASIICGYYPSFQPTASLRAVRKSLYRPENLVVQRLHTYLPNILPADFDRAARHIVIMHQ